jgi:hypothetical protein
MACREEGSWAFNSPRATSLGGATNRALNFVLHTFKFSKTTKILNYWVEYCGAFVILPVPLVLRL